MPFGSVRISATRSEIFWPEQHAAAARLGALADDDLDRVGGAQVVRVHAVARRQILVDERLGMPALLLRHAAVAGGGRGAGERRAAAERLLRLRRERAKAHAGDGDRDFELDRLLRVARAEHDVGAAALAVAFERIARDRRAEEQEVVEMRQLPLRAGAADVVDAGGRGAPDFRQRVVVEGRGGAGRGGRILVGHGAIPLPRSGKPSPLWGRVS